MPRRTTFRNPLTGRFVSAAEAAGLPQVIRDVFDGGLVEQQILQFGQVAEDLTQEAEPNWTERETRRGYVWESEDDSLSLSALGDADFPSDATHFRIVYTVSEDSRYRGGHASTEWLQIDTFRPDLSLLQGVNASGIARIFFEKG